MFYFVLVAKAYGFCLAARPVNSDYILNVLETVKFVFCLQIHALSKDLPNMNTFCDWLFETIVTRVYDSFFRNYISIVLLSFIVFTSQSQRLFI